MILNDPIGTIGMAVFSESPVGWLPCDGRELLVSEYPKLYREIGNVYGSSSSSNFRLPDLRGRVPKGTGANGISLGQQGGQETVQITEETMPQHRHEFKGTSDLAGVRTTAGNLFASGAVVGPYANVGSTVSLNENSIESVGGVDSHENMQPFSTINYFIRVI